MRIQTRHTYPFQDILIRRWRENGSYHRLDGPAIEGFRNKAEAPGGSDSYYYCEGICHVGFSGDRAYNEAVRRRGGSVPVK